MDKEDIMKNLEVRYLERLAELYPTIAAASTEVINLEAIVNLPKGTEHFLTDIHGEYEAFSHVLKNGSGAVKRKIDDVFGNTLSRQDKQSLATLIYYPREKMSRILQTETNPDDWYKITLYRLIEVSRRANEQVYALQGAQGPAERICLCHGRASHRKSRFNGQRIIL